MTKKQPPVRLAELPRAYCTATKLVNLYGPDYRPYVSFVENETSETLPSSLFTDADVLAALETAAEMVVALGDIVVPLFERLEQEVARRESNAKARARASILVAKSRQSAAPN